jgi:hypothetical protein
VLVLTGYYPVLGWDGVPVRRARRRPARAAARADRGAAAGRAERCWRRRPAPRRRCCSARSAATTEIGVDRDEVDAGRFGTVPTTTPWWLATDAPHSTTPPDLLHTTGTALAVLGLALLVARRLPRLLSPLAAAGSMPLTLYSAHVVVLSAVDDDADPLLLWSVQVAAALLLAELWRRHVGRGPLEALLARLTRAVTPGTGPTRT